MVSSGSKRKTSNCTVSCRQFWCARRQIVRTAPTNWRLARVVSALRSLIAFTAWSSFAHALVMGTMAFQFASQRVGFLWGSVVLAVIGVALIVLAPANASAAFASAPED
jgi:hypothetical protein